MPVYGFRAPAFLPQEPLRLLLGVRAGKVITTKTWAKLAIPWQKCQFPRFAIS